MTELKVFLLIICISISLFILFFGISYLSIANTKALLMDYLIIYVIVYCITSFKKKWVTLSKYSIQIFLSITIIILQYIYLYFMTE